MTKQGKRFKDLDIKDKSKDNEKGSRSKITKHEGTSLQRIQRPRPRDLNDKINIIDLTKECHNELTSGEIVSLKILSRTMEVRWRWPPPPDNENDDTRDKYDDVSVLKNSYDQDSPKDMFTMGASHTLEATHVEFFSDEDEPEVDLGNIINSYTVPTTPNTRIHKDHPIENVIGDVKSSVWILVDFPIGKRAIRTEWVLRNKKDERGIVIRNKARFKRGKIDQTLFIKKQKGDILLIHVYVGDIIFDSTNKDLCTGFEKLLIDKFQITFFLGLQSALTLVDLEKPLVKDGDADDVDVHLYRSMIGFQVTPKTSHLLAVKRIFRYLKGKPTLGLWYSRDSPFELVAYSNSDYARATQDRKSTTEGCQFLGNRHVKRGRDTKIPQSSGPPVKVGDEAVHKELGDRMERAATTASSLEAEQDSGSGPRCQDTILGGVDAQTRFETTSKQSNDPPLSRVNTLGSGEDSMKLMELMAHCTKLSELFWGTATARTTDDGEVEITASIDGQVKTITEASLRRHLKLEDSDGITSLPNTEIF
ncbi:hypothetical protein Tco_0098513 [Tanacetum coccineum]